MGGHLSICQADFGPATPTMMLRMPKVVKKRKSLGKCRAAGMVDSCLMSAFYECFGLKQQKDVACSDRTSSKSWLWRWQKESVSSPNICKDRRAWFVDLGLWWFLRQWWEQFGTTVTTGNYCLIKGIQSSWASEQKYYKKSRLHLQNGSSKDLHGHFWTPKKRWANMHPTAWAKVIFSHAWLHFIWCRSQSSKNINFSFSYSSQSESVYIINLIPGAWLQDSNLGMWRWWRTAPQLAWKSLYGNYQYLVLITKQGGCLAHHIPRQLLQLATRISNATGSRDVMTWNKVYILSTNKLADSFGECPSSTATRATNQWLSLRS